MTRSTTVVLLTLASALAAQQRPKVVPPKPKAVKPRRVDSELIERLRKSLAAAQQKRPFQIHTPVVQFKNWIGPGRGRAFAPRFQIQPGNPLLRGKLKRALDAFDKLRAGLYSESDPERAKQVLTDLERQLIAVRRALFEQRKAPRTSSVGYRFVTGAISVPQWGQLTGGNVKPQLRIKVGNRWVRAVRNPILHGAYAKGVQGIQSTRARLDKECDRVKAKALVDQLTRDVLAARAGLWRLHLAKRRR